MSEMRMEKDKGQITKSLLVYAKDCEFHPGWENHWRILKTDIAWMNFHFWKITLEEEHGIEEGENKQQRPGEQDRDAKDLNLGSTVKVKEG